MDDIWKGQAGDTLCQSLYYKWQSSNPLLAGVGKKDCGFWV